MNSNNDKKDKNTSFHTIVVTSPNESAAQAALEGPLHPSNLPTSSSVKIISTCDPYQTRLGSGGGTLAALSQADASSKADGSVLIIHAGGQSSRCPTQMTLGKAWTDLPVLLDNKTRLTNPTYTLIEALSNLLIPSGSIVVAASDVILHWPSSSDEQKLDLTKVSHDKVVGLAVPAPLTTAQNHGVFSLYAKNKKSHIQAVDTFFQKPSIETMKTECTITDDDMAWVDTGVIVFLPLAARVLRKLYQDELFQCYTAKGLASIYHDHHQAEKKEQSIQQFAKAPSKLELYSHILLSISTKGAIEEMNQQERLQHYVASNSDLCPTLLETMFRYFSEIELQVCTVDQGKFLHLGTTEELLQFYTSPGVLPLTNRAYTSLNDNNDINPSCVVINSDVTSSKIGANSLVEHCFLRDTTLEVGSNCVVSGLRGKFDTDVIRIPSKMVLQMLPLTETSFIILYLGLHDPIKQSHNGRCYHQAWDIFLRDTGLSVADLWEPRHPQNLLWNAKLHPVITITSDLTLDWEPFHWITQYINVKEKEGISSSPGMELLIQDTSSFQKWKALPRLSLADIQQKANARTEFSYRSQLKGSIVWSRDQLPLCKTILNQRKHEEIKIFLPSRRMDNSIMLYSLYIQPMLCMLQNVIWSALQEDSYDIASRCFMILGDAFSEYAEIIAVLLSEQKPRSLDGRHDIVTLYIQSLRSSSTDDNNDLGCRTMFEYLHETTEEAINCHNTVILLELASLLEDISFALTAKCVAASPTRTSQSGELSPLGSWYISTAPARIDLSGGWSDTPPISYEYGGAVACLAITLGEDMVKPLSARCRRTARKGITLIVENRDIVTGNLVQEPTSLHLTKVKELSDYSDPTAPCALLKCALLALDVVPLSALDNGDLEFGPFFLDPQGNTFGLDLISTSLLPQGSGLGTSSILAGCILSSLGRCLRIPIEPNSLIPTILHLEQLLSTGGGWQDQVGGIYPGLKLCSAEINVMKPIQVNVTAHNLSPSMVDALNQRLFLAYSGQPRLAKNILQKVLKQWATRSPIIVRTVQQLVQGAHEVISTLTETENLDDLGRLMNEYWSQKKIMAGGAESGVEPIKIAKLLESLSDLLDGATLAGAGGGGFLACLLKEETTREEVRKAAQAEEDIHWFPCQICLEGLTSFTLNDDEDEFRLKWHSTNFLKCTL